MKNRKKYPDEWCDVIRPAILKRDHYKCVDCGITHRSSYYMRGKDVVEVMDTFILNWCLKNNIVVKTIYLQVCHNDQNVLNNNYDNLAARCARCHRIYDRKYDRVKRVAPRTSKAICLVKL